MDESTRYRTTDLYLYSEQDLTELAEALQVQRPALHIVVNRLNHRGVAYFCNFSIDQEAEHPEPGIVAMLTAIEGFDRPLRSIWEGCSQRVFDIAYDCGPTPFAFRQDLTAETLGRLATAGVSLRITLYNDAASGLPEPTDGGQNSSETDPPQASA